MSKTRKIKIELDDEGLDLKRGEEELEETVERK